MLSNTKRDQILASFCAFFRAELSFTRRIGSIGNAKMWESETLTANQDGKRLVGPLRDDAETSSYKLEHIARDP